MKSFLAAEHENIQQQNASMMGRKPNKLTVSFDNNATIHELLPHVTNDFGDGDTHEEMAPHTFWFNKDDFKRMRDADRCIVQKFRVGAPIPSEARGLETRSPIALMEKRLAKMDGIAAVLGEQSRQKDLGYRDDESIRNRYLITTRDLVAEAISRASKDAEAVNSESDDGSPPQSTNSDNNNIVDLPHQTGRSKFTCEKDEQGKQRKSFNALGTRKSLQRILYRASLVMKRQEPMK